MKKSRLRVWTGRSLLALSALLVMATLALTFGWPAEPFAPDSHAARWVQDGPHKIEKWSLSLEDPSRPTAPNGNYPGAASRQFDTDVFYPEPDGGSTQALPVALYLHGLASWKEGGRHFEKFLASHGYVVLAADFPLTNFFAPGGPNPQDVINQPGDVSFFIDQLALWNQQPGHPLHGRIDMDRIALLGYSLGGMTATLATFHPQLRDDRVAATLSMAGLSSMFAPAFFAHSQVPFLMLAGDDDVIVDYPLNALDLPLRAPDAQLVTLDGGTHLGFMVAAPLLRWMDNPDRVGCLVLSHVLGGATTEDTAIWLESLGPAEAGIVPRTTLPCPDADYAPALNPLRQHMLAKVVVLGFLQSQFADSAGERQEAHRFISEILATEAPDVRWQGPSLVPLGQEL